MNNIIKVHIEKKRLEIHKLSTIGEITKYQTSLHKSAKIISEELHRVNDVKNFVEISNTSVISCRIGTLVIFIISMIGAGIAWPFFQKWMGF